MRQSHVSHADRVERFPGCWLIDSGNSCDGVAIIKGSAARQAILKRIVKIAISVGHIREIFASDDGLNTF